MMTILIPLPNMFIAITGMPGHGKTLSMTILGVNLSKLMNVPLFATYTLNDVQYTKVRTIEELLAMQTGVVLLDEFWLNMDSRSFSQNVQLSQWVMQARKKSLLCFYTSQTMRQVDLRVRNITDWWIHVEERREGIWLNFVLYQYGRLGSRFLLAAPHEYHKLYNTNEILSPLTSRASLGVGGGGRGTRPAP